MIFDRDRVALENISVFVCYCSFAWWFVCLFIHLVDGFVQLFVCSFIYCLFACSIICLSYLFSRSLNLVVCSLFAQWVVFQSFVCGFFVCLFFHSVSGWIICQLVFVCPLVLSVHSFAQRGVCFVCLLIHVFVGALFCLLVHSFFQWLVIQSFAGWVVFSFIHPFIYLSIHTFTSMCCFRRSFSCCTRRLGITS